MMSSYADLNRNSSGDTIYMYSPSFIVQALMLLKILMGGIGVGLSDHSTAFAFFSFFSLFFFFLIL